VVEAEALWTISITLMAEISSHIFSLKSTDGQSEICLRSIVAEPVRDSRFLSGCVGGEEFRSLFLFLMVPYQVVIIVGAA
jgi:hypothetical protein